MGKTIEWVMVTAISLAGAYVVATVANNFIAQSFAEAARNIEQMGAGK